MPNWCEGTLKIKGSKQNIVSWVKECMIAYGRSWTDENGYHEGKSFSPVIEEGKYGGTIIRYPKQATNGCYWIDESRRHFVGDGTDIEMWFEDDKEEVIVFNDFKAAWHIDTEPFIKMAQQYQIDFRIDGYECGMEFHQMVEVLRNGSCKEKTEVFDNYKWECPFPEMGG